MTKTEELTSTNQHHEILSFQICIQIYTAMLAANENGIDSTILFEYIIN